MSHATDSTDAHSLACPAPLFICHDRPAGLWTRAMPIGNGSLGAMVFGQAPDEKIQLNFETLWARVKGDRNNPDALKYLPRVRQLLLDGRPDLAMELANRTMLATPRQIQPYQTMGDLFYFAQAEDQPQPVSDYHRELDLRRAVVTTTFRQGDVTHRREAFATHPAGVIAMRFSASRPASISGGWNLIRRMDTLTLRQGQDKLVMQGQCGTQGTKFACVAEVIPQGKQAKFDSAGDFVSVLDADSVIVLIAAASDYQDHDYLARANRLIAKAKKKGFDSLLAEHVADYRQIFDRVELSLPNLPEDQHATSLATDQRLERIKAGQSDASLLATYFQFGRYLMISSSRPGTLPSTLQGLWNESLNPPWQSDYHININTQMNYWPADSTNLSELHRPLFDWMKGLAQKGRKTAKVHYGCRGWVAHHLSDLWHFTGPADSPRYGLWPMGGGWLCLHLWDHYRFTHDRTFLKETGYPLMKGSVRFFLDFLSPDDKGRLVCSPSMSPENVYRLPNGAQGVTCMGCAMDNQIITELFNACIQAADVLKVDRALVSQIKQALARLAPPVQVGADGRLMEWFEPYQETEPGHRHISHLLALYPGTLIDVRKTPHWARAADKTLEYRLSHGGGHTGWSAAWIVNFRARLGQADKAHAMLTNLLTKSTLPNLFDDHPPFQIDGNFGATAGIAEMLLQSHQDEIRLLPALPKKAWPKGYVIGLRARGGVTVGIAWDQGRITQATFQADRSGEFVVRWPSGTKPAHPPMASLSQVDETAARVSLVAGQCSQWGF